MASHISYISFSTYSGKCLNFELFAQEIITNLVEHLIGQIKLSESGSRFIMMPKVTVVSCQKHTKHLQNKMPPVGPKSNQLPKKIGKIISRVDLLV